MATPRWKLRPVELSRVTITDGFWAERQRLNREVTLPYEFDCCKATGRIDALRRKYKPGQGEPPHIFWDSDVAKWLEAACYSLTTHPDVKLAKRVDEVAGLFAASQQPDGYINSHYTVVEQDKRWTNLRDRHELYCAGHLMEAAVAHHQATGSRTLLDALCRYADYIASVFGPDRRAGYPGHEEIELALVKLYHATGERRYLDLSAHFVDARGRQPHYFDQEAEARGDDPKTYRHRAYDYNQSHLPVREQTEAVGHSVRAMYLYSGMADLAAELGDDALLRACAELWESAAARRMYITGGVGPRHEGERFTTDYDLPNADAYAETCAAIGLVFFSHRMLQITGDGRYADAMERALYNGALPGVGLSGEEFFYVNPLESAGDHVRQPWFGCACCPPNIARLIASVGRYGYSSARGAAYVHLYASGTAQLDVGGRPVTLTQQTGYPWDGEATITVETEAASPLALCLRIPGWCKRHRASVNGRKAQGSLSKGYLTIRRQWQAGDIVELSLAMPVERVTAHPRVTTNAGRVAIQRGPLVYCLEQCDHQPDVRAIRVRDRAKLSARFLPKLLGGTVVVEGEGLADAAKGWSKTLYRRANEPQTRTVPIRAVPYFLWANRAHGPMALWLPRA